MNVKRIEFMVTYNCSGKCKHCSVSDVLHTGSYNCVDMQKASTAIDKLSKLFPLESVMPFGGEPLLYVDGVCLLHKTAKKCAIGKRQLITNGYFNKSKEKIIEAVNKLKESELTEILLSVDAFHQDTIPVDLVHFFAETALKVDINNIQLHPAWVVNESHDNMYNKLTKSVLEAFSDLNIKISNGNNVFMSGNAVKYLSEYYEKPGLDLDTHCGERPYTTVLDNVTSLSIVPNGNVLVCCHTIGNIYIEDISDIISRYNPYEHPIMKILLKGGMQELIDYARKVGLDIDINQCYSICDVCHLLIEKAP